MADQHPFDNQIFHKEYGVFRIVFVNAAGSKYLVEPIPARPQTSYEFSAHNSNIYTMTEYVNAAKRGLKGMTSTICRRNYSDSLWVPKAEFPDAWMLGYVGGVTDLRTIVRSNLLGGEKLAFRYW